MRRERDPVWFAERAGRRVAVAEDPSENAMPITIEMVLAGAIMGDISETLRTVLGRYCETPVF